VSLKSYQIERDGHEIVHAKLLIDGQEVEVNGSGDGVVSAFLDAWAKQSGQQVNVIDYSEHAIGEGTSAEAAAYYLINVDGARVGGMALDNDSLGASLRALISAINRAKSEARAAA
jgi:2-isopropylmalate synthase